MSYSKGKDSWTALLGFGADRQNLLKSAFFTTVQYTPLYNGPIFYSVPSLMAMSVIAFRMAISCWLRTQVGRVRYFVFAMRLMDLRVPVVSKGNRKGRVGRGFFFFLQGLGGLRKNRK